MTIGLTGLGPVTGQVGNGADTWDHHSPTDPVDDYVGETELRADAYCNHSNQTYTGGFMPLCPRHPLLGMKTSREAKVEAGAGGSAGLVAFIKQE